jgi:hypothetical protein
MFVQIKRLLSFFDNGAFNETELSSKLFYYELSLDLE